MTLYLDDSFDGSYSNVYIAIVKFIDADSVCTSMSDHPQVGEPFQNVLISAALKITSAPGHKNCT